MNHVQILDCTLRDGAYLINKQFGDNNIHGIVNGLINTQIDWIEIGFLQDEGKGEGKTVFLNSIDAEKHIPEFHGNSHFTAFADYSRYSIKNLDEYTGRSFEAVRACFFKEERNDVIEFCHQIKRKGYILFVQPVDVLGYSESELIELIRDVNSIHPDVFSIVDSFGSMYEDDLQRIFSLIDQKLVSDCKIGFHSHNNMQMSSALSQAFIKMSHGRREVVVDSTISGMGRGAGNTPTELIAQYLISKWVYNYDIDAILDVIDTYMDNIRTRCTWGYSTPFFISGSYSAHVNNISYLLEKNSIRSKDIRHILNQVGDDKRKRYDYGFLESEYMKYMAANIDDIASMASLKAILSERNVVILAPGRSVRTEARRIQEFIEQNSATVISINFIPQNVKVDFLYMSNAKRFYSEGTAQLDDNINKIYTSNIKTEGEKGEYIISFNRLARIGWEHMDNSAIMLMRLLNELDVALIAIAGLDGYDNAQSSGNYFDPALELHSTVENPDVLNREICEMLADFFVTKKTQVEVKFITTSRFERKLA